MSLNTYFYYNFILLEL